MPNTEKQRTQRNQYLGSSDMPAVLGVDPWRNKHDVWLEKTGRLVAKEPNAAMEAGTMFEDGVLQWAAKKLGSLKRNQFRVCPGTPLASHIDAITEKPEPVEGKTVGLFGPIQEEWGEPGTDEVPQRVIVQCHVHMLCMSRFDICHVPAFLGGRGFAMYHVPFNAGIAEILVNEAIGFWRDHVAPDVPPPDMHPSIEVVKRIQRIPGHLAHLPQSLIDWWLTAKEATKSAREIEKQAQAQVLAALGDCEVGIVDETRDQITYYEQARKGYTVDPCSYRVLRMKRAKETQ